MDIALRLRNSIESQCSGWSTLHGQETENVPRREILVMQDCIDHIENRRQTFGHIVGNSKRLEEWVNDQTVLTKDRHDKAIYAFTIVTVIFLPLSFVTSFLGMNTTGIRDTQYGQWMFWVTALPLTLVVILLALLWTSELGHAWKSLTDPLFRRNRLFKGPKPISRGSGRGNSLSLRKAILGRKEAFSTDNGGHSRRMPPITPQKVLPQEAWEKPYRRTRTFASEME